MRFNKYLVPLCPWPKATDRVGGGTFRFWCLRSCSVCVNLDFKLVLYLPKLCTFSCGVDFNWLLFYSVFWHLYL